MVNDMSKVIDIESNMPHACIIGPLNEPHVIPIQALKRMAKGSINIINKGQEREDEDMIRGLICDWLILNGHGE